MTSGTISHDALYPPESRSPDEHARARRLLFLDAAECARKQRERESVAARAFALVLDRATHLRHPECDCASCLPWTY